MKAAWPSEMPGEVRVVEVGPRDGLQNEHVVVATEDKVRYIELLAEAGLADIEVSSFVHPQRVPQLADAGRVFAALTPRSHVRYCALVPNRRGLERALDAGVRAIALFTAASETFTLQNIGMDIAGSLAVYQDLLPAARNAGTWVRAYVSTAFYCPYEGAVPVERVLAVIQELDAMGVDEISLGDTVGQATPGEVARLTERVIDLTPRAAIAYHFHDTRGTALANVLMALQYGIKIFDTAAGGIGGCPFAPGAAGNLATEDLLFLLHGMGIQTGVALEQVVLASRFLESRLKRRLPGKYLQASSAGTTTGSAM